MTIVGTAKVPSNGNLALIPTIELSKIRTSHRKPEPATPCPPWCAKHSTGTPGFPADRTTDHETARVAVETTFTSGPVERVVDRHDVEVWAERFDSDPGEDENPVVGYPMVHLSVDHYDSTGMTAEQAERIGRALLDSAGAARIESNRLAGRTSQTVTGSDLNRSPVWPPKTCPSWCSYADDPAMHNEQHGPVPQDDRTHLHSCYPCVPESDPNSSDLEPGAVELSLEPVHRYGDGQNPKTVHQHLYTGLALHYREIEPTIRVGHFGEKPGSPTSQFDITLTEAEQLAKQLGHLVDLGRRG